MADSDSSEGVLNMSDLDPDERRELEDELRAMAEEGERRLAPGSGMASRMLGALNVTPEDAAVFREYVRSQEPLCVPSTDEELSDDFPPGYFEKESGNIYGRPRKRKSSDGSQYSFGGDGGGWSPGSDGGRSPLGGDSDPRATYMRGLEDEIDRLDQLMKLKYEEMVRAEAAWAAEAESSESAHKQTRMNFRKNWNLREKSDVSTSLRFLKKNQSRRDSNTEATVSRLKQDMTDLWGELCPNGTLCTCGAVLGDAYSFKDIIVVNFSFIETCSLPMFKLCSNAKCKGEAFNPLSLGYFPAQPIQQTTWFNEELLLFWLESRAVMPTGFSINGTHNAFHAYHQNAGHARKTDSATFSVKNLSNVLDQYNRHRLAMGASLVLLPEQFVKSGDSDNQLVSPLSRCPCCSFKLRGGTQDCMFKACRSNRQDSHADIDDFVGRGVNITPNEMEQRQKEIETKTGKKASNKPTAADTCVTNYASDNDRAKQRFMNDIQALGGFACRHGIILYSFFIRTGERYGYFHCVLSRLQEDAATYGFEIPDTLVVHYDVACRFAIYMRNRSTGEWMPTYCTGKLHGITHSLLCQLRNMGLYTPGAGNSCGEQLEQAWSQVGKNWQLVRSYEPFRFAIYYDDQIHHWNIVALDSLPDRLVSDFNRAYAAKYQLDDETPALFADSVPQNEDLSDKYDEIKECLEAAARSKGNAVFSSADIQDADVNYVRQILELNVRLAEEKRFGNVTDDAAIRSNPQMKKIDEKLQRYEREKGFSSRWDAENPKFQEAVRVILESDLVQLQTSLEDLRSKLLELKPEPNTARSDTLKKQKRRNDLLRQMGKQYAQWTTTFKRHCDATNGVYAIPDTLEVLRKSENGFLFPWEKEERCTAEGKKRELSRRYLDAVAGRRRMEEELTMIKEEVNDGVKALHLHVEHLVGQCKSTSKAAVGTEAEGKHILYQAALKKKWGSFLKMKKARQVIDPNGAWRTAAQQDLVNPVMDALNLSTSPPQPAARDSSPNSVPLSTPANQPISSLASSTTEPRGAEEVEPKGNADKKEDKPVDEDEPDYSGSELDDDELFDEEYDAFQPSEGYTSEFDEDGELVRRFGYARPTTITQTPVAVDNTEVY